MKKFIIAAARRHDYSMHEPAQSHWSNETMKGVVSTDDTQEHEDDDLNITVGNVLFVLALVVVVILIAIGWALTSWWNQFLERNPCELAFAPP